MAQSDYTIPNVSAPAARADLNGTFLAIATNNSGATAPAAPFAYQWWYDTTANILKLRNAANSAWINVAAFNQSAGNFLILSRALPTSDWETGTSTVETVVSPAKMAAAIATQAGDVLTDAIEGNPGAPRIQTPLLEARTLTSQTAAIFTNLPYPCIFEFEISTSTNNDSGLFMQMSRNNGATWEANRALGGGSVESTQFCYGTLAFQGTYFIACIGFSNSPAGAAVTGNLLGGNIGVAGGFIEPNAFRFTLGGGGAFTGTIRVYRGFQRGT